MSKRNSGWYAVYLVGKNEPGCIECGDLIHVEPYGFGRDIKDAASDAAMLADNYKGFSPGTRPAIRRHDLPPGTVDVLLVNSGAWYAFDGYLDDHETANRVAAWLEDEGLLHGYSYIALGPAGYGEDGLGYYGDLTAVAVIRDE